MNRFIDLKNKGLFLQLDGMQVLEQLTEKFLLVEDSSPDFQTQTARGNFLKLF